ncbi:MAG TPA: hypothetical protein VFU30_11895 [Gaiellaceae bacterium]|nr:hypothetical protein [Gaiellaceae bacterium]
MPLHEDLARRVLEAQERAASLSAAAQRSCEFARAVPRARRGEGLLRQCAWCRRLNVGGRWLELESLAEGRYRISTALLKRSTSGICPDCFKEQSDEVDEARARRPAGRANG